MQSRPVSAAMMCCLVDQPVWFQRTVVYTTGLSACHERRREPRAIVRDHRCLLLLTLPHRCQMRSLRRLLRLLAFCPILDIATSRLLHSIHVQHGTSLLEVQHKLNFFVHSQAIPCSHDMCQWPRGCNPSMGQVLLDDTSSWHKHNPSGSAELLQAAAA